MYYNHNLRADLQEWKSRLTRADYNQFGTQLKFFFEFLEKNKLISSLLMEANNKYKFEVLYFENLDRTERYFDSEFQNSVEQTAYCYQLMQHIISKLKQGFHLINQNVYLGTGDYDDQSSVIIDNIITPMIYYFHDVLDKSNSTTYLLEKYKKRVEWFTKSSLVEKYETATKNYEDILEEDLRLFLFDQGIDYPFSTPKSASGRADIIGAIDTEDPLIVEIKILDKDKKYGLERIKSGLNQILKYTNDYNKNDGYLVIYNFDKIHYDFKLKDSNSFPPMLILNNKSYYFIIIDMYNKSSASKLGQIEKIEITETILLNNI
ncbi:MAG: hypothetical protein R2797_00070 [Gelidibacter sp.]